MPGLRRALLALFALGVLFAGADVALVLTSDHETQKALAAVLIPLIGLAFVGTGTFAWWRRPLNRFGLLMTAVGFAWFVGGLTESNNAVVYTTGSFVGPLYLVLVVQLVLSFPTGRLGAGGPRAGRPGRAAGARRDRLHRRLRHHAAGLPARRRHHPARRRARQRVRHRARA